MGTKKKQWATTVGLLVLVVFAVMGVLSVIGVDPEHRADEAPVVVVSAEPAEETAEQEESDYLTPQERQYFTEATELTDELFGAYIGLNEMHRQLLLHYANPGSTSLDAELMAAELDSFGTALAAWEKRKTAPAQFSAYDEAVSNLVNQMTLYRTLLDSGMKKNTDHAFTAEGQMRHVQTAAETVVAALDELRGEGS